MINGKFCIGNEVRKYQRAFISDVASYVFEERLLILNVMDHFQADNKVVLTREWVFGAVTVEDRDAVLQLSLHYLGAGQRCLFVGDVISMEPQVLMLLRVGDQV